MEKPKNQTLQRVAKLLDERNVEYKVEISYDLVFASEKLFIKDLYGNVYAIVRPSGRDVRMTVEQVPVEGAVMALCGPDKSLEEEYPTAKRHMSFGGISMNLETDRRDVLMTAEEVERLEKHVRRLNAKSDNQRKEIKRLHVKCMQQQGEILRMEENSLRMAVLAEGYAEGES